MELSKEYHAHQKKKAEAQEKLINEEKLKHLNLLQYKSTPENTNLPAEFMPMPGSVPVPKPRDGLVLADHGIPI